MKNLSPNLKKVLLIAGIVAAFISVSYLISFVENEIILFILAFLWCVISAFGLYKLFNKYLSGKRE